VNLSESDGLAAVRRAVEAGVNFFDTADVYGLGRSEELLGAALRGAGDDALIATKGGNEWDPVTKERLRLNNRPAYLRGALEASLRRLRRSHVDLYYIHRLDGETPLCDSFGELMRMKEEGKIRAAGLSNVTVCQIQAAMCAGPVDAVQNEYNLLLREAEEEVIPFCEDNDISFIPYGPLAYGLLAGKRRRRVRPPTGDWRSRTPLFSKTNYVRVLHVVDGIKALAKARGVAPAHVALRWVLRVRVAPSAIAGAKNAAQIEENAQAVGWTLSDDEIEQLDRLTGNLHWLRHPA
jgi:aryl-alcohol dehydrogenase-like predicted oxidoreductase